jgi:beta-galactosidase
MIRNLTLCSLCVCLFSVPAMTPLPAAEPGSAIIRLEDGWRFSIDEEEEPQERAFDERSWKTVSLPNNAQDISDELPHSTRPVWFRNSFRLAKVAPDSKVILLVDDASRVEAWVNEASVDRLPQGRYALEKDITDLVRSGENLLVVRASVPGISGGIYVHILPPVHAQPTSLLIDTPGWKGGPVSARMRARVGNHSKRAQQIRLRVTIEDDRGRELAAALSEETQIPPGSVRNMELRSNSVPHPPLWSVNSPRRCKAVWKLTADGKTVQKEETLFGFRWFEFDPEEGFFLNGKPLELRGTVYTKTASGPFSSRSAMWAYEVDILKQMGVNFVRPAEGGICDAFLEECDRNGLLATVNVHAEASLEHMDENIRRDVERNYNRPSIIAWNFNGEGKSSAMSRLQSEAARTLRHYDPTRVVFCVELGWRSPGAVGLVDADVAGQGNYTGWYEGTLDHIGPYMDAYRELLKERYGRFLPVVVSNYGAAADPSVRTESPRRNDYSEEYFTAFHKRFVQEIAARKWMAGGLIFTFRDIQSGQPIPRHTWKGVIDLLENKRDAYYYYQSIWTEKPMVHIVQKAWSIRDVWPAETTRGVEVFSNCPTVELFHNGMSLGQRSRAENLVWQVPLKAGANSLRAVGLNGPHKVEDLAFIQVTVRPPAVEPRLLTTRDGGLQLHWTPVEGVRAYAIYGSAEPGFKISESCRVTTTSGTSLRIPRPGGSFYYRVAALHGGKPGTPSIEVGWGPGALQWRFANSGWFLSSPALADLNGDGRLEIVIGSYNGKVYALDSEGNLLWEFDTGDTVFSSPAVAELEKGAGPSIVISSSRVLYVLSASGSLRWKQEGIRQFDRNTKSPAVGDLDGDGQAEIVAASDTGELTVFSAGGKRIWSYSTAASRNRGLNLATPVLVDIGNGRKGVFFGADDGYMYLLDNEGNLLFKYDTGLGDYFPGPVPGVLTPAAGQLVQDGPVRLLTGAGGLRVLDLRGNVVWERKNLQGVPQISQLFGDGRRQVVVTSGARVTVLDAQGEEIWQARLSHPRDFFTHSPVPAEFSEDPGHELLVGTRATYLRAYNSAGKELWAFKTDDELSSMAAVADVNRDGFANIVVASRDGYLYFVGGSRIEQDAPASLQFRGGATRTGDYSR